MSSFVATSGFGGGPHTRDNFSCCEWATNGDLYGPKIRDDILAADYFFDAFFESEWWPSRSSMMGGWDGVGENALLGKAPWWKRPNTRSGCNGRLGITGITRDQYGSPLGFCAVKMFRTSTDELVSSVVSDANGVYLITTPYYPDTHYLVVYKTGSPDTFGTTANTLIAG